MALELAWEEILGPKGAVVLVLAGLIWMVKKNEALEKDRSENVKNLVTTVKAQGDQVHAVLKEELKGCHERNLHLDGKVYEMAKDIVELKMKGFTDGS